MLDPVMYGTYMPNHSGADLLSLLRWIVVENGVRLVLRTERTPMPATKFVLNSEHTLACLEICSLFDLSRILSLRRSFDRPQVAREYFIPKSFLTLIHQDIVSRIPSRWGMFILHCSTGGVRCFAGKDALI